MIEKLKASPLLQKLGGEPARKYLALGLVCLLLLVSVLLASGGRARPEPLPESSEAVTTQPAATEPPAPPPVLAGAVEIAGLEMGPEESVFGLCRDGDSAAVMLSRWDEDAQVWRCRLAELDPKTASVTAVVELEPMGEGATFAWLELTETEIRFVDRDSERCAAFDRSGRFLGIQDHPVMDKAHLGWRNVLLSDGCFYKQARWAEISRSDSGSLNRVVAFYDEKDCVHVIGEPYDQIRDAAGHRLLTLRVGENNLQELALLDLDRGLCLDRLSLTPEQGEELGDALLGGDWALLCLTAQEPSNAKRLLFWYPEAGRESPIETATLTERDLIDEISVLSEKLAQAGISLRLDEAPPAEQTPTTGLQVYESSCETGASLFGQYWILSELDHFVEKLPAGMVRELSQELPGGDGSEAEPLQLYIVRSIPGDAAAFANAWTEPPMLCFATEEFSPSHLAHEFMHVMDLRLSRWLETQRRDLENEWWALSPAYAYEEGLSQEQSDALEAYFVSWYARTNSNEDRADSFQMLFDSDEPLAEQWWYAEKPGVQAKLRWLTENIRAAFPSVQAVERAWWEKLPPEPEE